MHMVDLYFAITGTPDSPNGAHGINQFIELAFLPRVGEQMEFWDSAPLPPPHWDSKGSTSITPPNESESPTNGRWWVYSVTHRIATCKKPNKTDKPVISYLVTLTRDKLK